MGANEKKVVTLPKRVVAVSVRKATDVEAPPVVIETNPLRMRVERREDGTWPSITTKMKLNLSDGPKTIYFTIGFGVVCGRMGGKEVCVERPLEFFVPASQTKTEQQWVSATMRLLSREAKNGSIAEALQDLRQVVDRDSVWHGKTKSGKTMVHDSAVAAIAWEMQQQLNKRGFLDELGNERPLQELAELHQRMRGHLEAIPDGAAHVLDAPAPQVPEKVTAMRDGMSIVATCPDKNCQGDMVLKDNCPTCLDCGYSKCG